MMLYHLVALKQDQITVSERNALVHLQAAVRSAGLNSTAYGIQVRLHVPHGVSDSQKTVSRTIL